MSEDLRPIGLKKPHKASLPDPLDYQSPNTRKPGISLTAQVLLGALMWGVVVVICWITPANSLDLNLLWISFGLLLAVAIFIRVRFRWRGLIPGLLLAFLLTLLVPIGIFWVLCGSFRK